MNIAVINFDANLGMYHESLLFFQRYLEIDNTISILGCSGHLGRCTNIISLGIKADQYLPDTLRKETCKKCISKQNQLSNNSQFRLNNQLDQLNIEQQRIIDGIKEEEVSDSRDLLRIRYLNVPFGKIAFYDFAMHNKIDDKVKINKEQIANFKFHLIDVFKVWNFIDRILITEKFDAAIYVNGNSSLNSIARERFLKNKIRCWSIEYTFANTATEKRVYLEENRLVHCREWPSFTRVSQGYKCIIADTEVALKGFRSRFRGVDHNSYTSPSRTTDWKSFDEFRGKFEQLASVFISSSDELRVHEVVYGFKQDNTFFGNQIEWLNFIIDKASPDIGYVIRIHPRLKPNKRDSVEAVEHQYIYAALQKARALKNFYIIEAEQTISSYYVLLNSSFSMVSWSMMGLESAVLNIPVVACFPGNSAFPIEKMSHQPKDLAELELFIQGKIQPKRTLEHDMEVLKWIGINYRAIGIRVMGVRYRIKFFAFMRSHLEKYILLSPKLFGIFFYYRNKNIIETSISNGEIRVTTQSHPVDDSEECIKMLNVFRNEIYKYYGCIRRIGVGN